MLQVSNYSMSTSPNLIMKKDLNSIIKSIGFDSKESALYIAGLELGGAPASEYARRTKLNRVTAYTTLEQMIKRGHCTVVKHRSGKWYTMVAPEYLAVEARKNVDALDHVLPELRSLQGAENRKPNVRFFEGWEGVRHVYEHTLTSSGEILNYANSATVRKHWENYDEEYVAERAKRGIHLKGIAPADAEGRRVQGHDKESLREIRLVPEKEFDFDNEINIYDNTVAITSFGCGGADIFGVLIESKEVAETQRQIFRMAWRYAGHDKH